MLKISSKVNRKPINYDIYIGYNMNDEIIKALYDKKYGTRYAIITDNIVNELYGNELSNKMIQAGFDVVLIEFPNGESYKTRETKKMLEDKLFYNNFGRDCCIIALGGGVVGDMAGYVAATYMRGINCIQIPTTTISQGDSSIGGKTAVDVEYGKNLIGCFHHPSAIFMDVQSLKTLDNRNYISGLVEIIKHSFIKDENFYEFIKTNLNTIINRNSVNFPEIMQDLIKINAKIKNEVVQVDDNENDIRKILNYGHTVGHAVEFLSNYTLLHGEAISIGIACEAFFSYKLEYCSKSVFKEQVGILSELGLQIEIPDEITTRKIVDIMILDKKSRDGESEFILLEKIGKYKISPNGVAFKIKKECIYNMLDEYRNL